MRLDDFVSSANVLFPECLKIDVDGHELEVFKGAELVLEDPRCRSIIFETDEHDRVTPSILAFVEKKGFILQKKTIIEVVMVFMIYSTLNSKL